MRILFPLALALLLAGCSSQPPAAGRSGEPQPAGPHRQEATWSNVTYTDVCNPPGCAGTHEEYSEWDLAVGSDLWLNVTWRSNDPLNDVLNVSLGGLSFSGRSPLAIHVASPPHDLAITVHGRENTYAEAPLGTRIYQPPPAQPFDAKANFLPLR